MPAPIQSRESSSFVRAHLAALLEIPGFEKVAAIWLQALASLALTSKSKRRRSYLSAVADLLRATEEALSMLPAGWTRALSPTYSGGGASPPPGGDPPRAAAMQLDQLTPREREVAALIARGCTNKQIAAALVVSDATAERHVANILAKLGLSSRVDIAIWSLSRDDSAA